MTKPDPLRELWMSEKEDPLKMSTAELRAHADHFQSKVRRRNMREYIACVIVLIAFGTMAVLMSDPIVKVGAILIVLATLYVGWTLHQLAGASEKDAVARAADLSSFHRQELERQRDALNSVWKWYLAPFVPGGILFNVGMSFSDDRLLTFEDKARDLAGSLLIAALIFGLVWWLNHRAVKHLDTRINRLKDDV